MMTMRSNFGVCLVLLFSASNIAAAPADRAEIWRSWPPSSRLAYVDGFRAGLQKAALETSWALIDRKTVDNPPQKLTAVMRRYNLRTFSYEQLCAVVDSLYADPANAHIFIEDAILIAYEKLSGADVSEALQVARRLAVEMDRLERERP